MNSFLNHNVTQVQTLTGKYPLPNGRPFFIALTRANRLEKLLVIMVFRMRLYDVFFVLLESSEQAVNY